MLYISLLAWAIRKNIKLFHTELYTKIRLHSHGNMQLFILYLLNIVHFLVIVEKMSSIE